MAEIKIKHFNPLWWITVIVVKLYRLISVHLPSRCRFYPSCSQYALDCLSKYGFLRAVSKIILRISKCHPFYPGGVDKA